MEKKEFNCRAEEQAKRERMRMEIVASLSADLIFEYDVRQDTMSYYNQSEEFSNAVLNAPVIEHYAERILNGSITALLAHPDDSEKMKDLCRQLRSDKREIYCEVRKQYEKQQYCWVSVKGKRVEGEGGFGETVIGKISNIEERVKKEAVLKFESERDSLTGLYNKKITKELVSKRLAANQAKEAYLLIADFDDFKAVNDTMGHLFGDAVLCTFADSLRVFFGEAIIGRIGGDEFLIYLEQVSSDEISRRTAEVNRRFERIYAEDAKKVKVCASFGMAECSEGLSYEQAVQHADSALYFLKKHEKGGIVEYHDGMRMGESAVGEETQVEDVSEAKIKTEKDLVAFAREVFGRVQDTKGAVRILSDCISRFFSFQDILLVQKQEDGTMRQFFHWGDQDIRQFYGVVVDSLQEDWKKLLYEDNKDYVVLRERDIIGENVNRAKSMISIRVCEQKEEGYMIFVDRRQERAWTKECRTLKKLSEIMFRNIMEMERKRQKEEHTAYMMNHDKLTGLPNYAFFLSYCEQYVKQHPEKRYALVCSDFSNFQYLNKIYGYAAGDQVLKDFSRKIQSESGIQYARVTGDKFLAMHEVEDIEVLKKQVLSYSEEFVQEVSLRYVQCRLAVTGGIAEIDQELESFAMNVDNADIARKSVKQSYGIQVQVYTHELRENVQKQMELAYHMMDGLSAGEFVLYLQPKIHMETGALIGAEALVRWIRKDGTIIPVEQFLPSFEKNGFITKVDFEMLRQVLKLQQEMRLSGKKELPIAVNFSKKHQENLEYMEELDALLEEYQASADMLEIEITESIFMRNVETLTQSIQALKQRGISVSIDDFGAGYSSLNLLSSIKADTVKLDRQFLLSVEKEQGGFAVEFLRLLIHMMEQLGFQIIAEGVETKEEAELLKNAGCHYAQGYYYAEPLPVDKFFEFMEKHGTSD